MLFIISSTKQSTEGGNAPLRVIIMNFHLEYKTHPYPVVRLFILTVSMKPLVCGGAFVLLLLDLSFAVPTDRKTVDEPLVSMNFSYTCLPRCLFYWVYHKIDMN